MFQIIDASHKSQCPDSSVPKSTSIFQKKKVQARSFKKWTLKLSKSKNNLPGRGDQPIFIESTFRDKIILTTYFNICYIEWFPISNFLIA